MKKADEAPSRKGKIEAPSRPPAHVKIRVSNYYFDTESILIDVYTKLDAIAALLMSAGHHPDSDPGRRAVGLSILLEDCARQLRAANGESDDDDQGGS